MTTNPITTQAINTALQAARDACSAAQLPHGELVGLDGISADDLVVQAATTVTARTRGAVQRDNGEADEPVRPGDAAELAACRALTHLVRAVTAEDAADTIDHAGRAAGAAQDARSAAAGLDEAEAEDLREAAWKRTVAELRGVTLPPTWTVGARVCGDGGSVGGVSDDDVEDGEVLEVRGYRVRVAWESGTRTWCDAESLSEAT